MVHGKPGGRRRPRSDLSEGNRFLLAAIVDSAQDAIIAKRLDGTITSWNAAAERLYGYAADEALGRHVSIIVPDERIAELDGLFAELANGRRIEPFETVRRTKDGSPIEVLLTLSPIFEPDGTVIGASAIARDLTAQKRAEAERDRLAAIVECSNDAIISWSPEGIVTSCNAQAEQIYGYPAEELVGRSIFTLIPDQRIERFERKLAKLRRGTLHDPFNDVALTEDGSLIDISVTISPIRAGDGAIVGYSTIARDISGQKRAAESLRRAKKEAERANRAKSEFLATMSHEIRTPLNGILGTAELLMLTELTPKQHEYAHIIRNSGQLLLRLLSDIIDLSRIETGHVTIEDSDLDLRELLDSVALVWGSRARQKGLEFFAVIEPDLPLKHRGDPDRIRQVLINLVSNAVKYTERGYIAVRVSAAADRGRNPVLRFEVKDTGAGIDRETSLRLFRRFERSDAARSNGPEGSGLGLAICKELVELMSGKIGVASAPGEGSTFWFTVTCHANAPGAKAAAPIAAGGPDRGGASALRILIVDDNVTNQTLLGEMLRAAGHAHDVARSGLEAIEAVRRRPYDLVLMDIRMPDMDGVAAARRIHSLGPGLADLPIVAVTANAMQDDRQSYLEVGMADYLAKPFTMHDVLSTVGRFARRAG